ncbi:hypothetical protein L1049_007091 [Liquidambar formosana]|uniref:non-specific serine/threonine protein kinase n=1 Tax=Liquidambar formosana TaxID=63359 RepID=A0AAP0RK08_LIQFO
MREPFLGSRVPTLFLLSLLPCFLPAHSQSTAKDDASVMAALKKSLKLPASLVWSDPNPCNWNQVQCSEDGRVTRIQIRLRGVTGTLPPNLGNLTALEGLDVEYNGLTGSLPSLSGLSSLQVLLLRNNNFSSIPPDFFAGMSSLQAVAIDYNPFSPWEIPASLRDASALQNFSATSANIIGKIPDFFGSVTGLAELVNLHMGFNSLEGGLPSSFSGSSIQSLWLNGQKTTKLNGTIDVLQNMTSLTEVWLLSNDFSGPLPDLSGLKDLRSLSLRDNSFTGPVPVSLVNLPSLQIVNLTNNLLQGPTPKFDSSVAVDMLGTNRFCLSVPGAACDSRVNILLSIAESVGYPAVFANNWKGNDPCSSWFGITCAGVNITAVNFHKSGLAGTISPNFSSLPSLQRLILSNNNLMGTIPNELTTLPNLQELVVSNNQLSGKVPSFKSNVNVLTDGNPNIGKVVTPPPSAPSGTSPGSTPGSGSGGDNSPGNGNKKSNTPVVVAAVVGCAGAVFFLGALGFCYYRKRQKRFGRVQSPNTTVIHRHRSGSDQDAVKITLAGSSVNGRGGETYGHTSSGPSDIHMVEAGSMEISFQVLRNVTNNFSEENILGRGGSGTVYKGELHDGTKIAVKRMESGVVSEKGLTDFKSEIAVVTKVRHRHLVGILGYCLDGNERLLVYQYMNQGTLSRFLFNWREEGLKPLEWTKRLTIALDVARGVEYLHSLAHHRFIHRDLKPSNILLGDDIRAKVADFGLARLVPEGKDSIETRLAGTFGYLAPEYGATGRVTTKIDVFSFGVILMELITGRKAVDGTRSEDSMHLPTWFRGIYIDKDAFRKAIDPTIDLDLDEETLASISTVSELANHCTATEPSQRPHMSHAVNVLSSLVELWKPADPDSDELYGIDLDSTANDDALVMAALKKSLTIPSSLDWSDANPCNWNQIQCSNGRVTRIQIGRQGVTGTLPPNLGNLTALERLEVQYNGLSGSLPSLSGLSSLQVLLLSNNNFTSIPPDFFAGMSSLQAVAIDYNRFSPWQIPASLRDASALQNFSATSANIIGKIPDFFGSDTGLAGLVNLHLAFNSLEGGLPSSFSGSSIQSLWLNGQTTKLNGTIDVLQNMTSLTEVWLHMNGFSGPLPDLSGLKDLRSLSLRDNSFTGPVPVSLVNLPFLQIVNLTNNLLQGPIPKFDSSVAVDMSGTNSFCLSVPGAACDSRVNILLLIAESVGYPAVFANNWKGNDPCSSWFGITCAGVNITVVNFQKMGLTGTISPNFSSLPSLQRLILSNNNLMGTIPNELTTLPNLKELDVSNNQLSGKVPSFKSNVNVLTDGNPNIGKNVTPPPSAPSGSSPGSTPGSGSGGDNSPGNGNKKSNTPVVVGAAVGCAGAVFFLGALGFCYYRKKQKRLGRVQSPNTMVIHPRHSGSDQDVVKITIAGSSVNGGGSETYSHASSGPSDVHMVEAGNMVISIQVLRNVTNNFSEENILGRGGFGTVYKGELHDGTKIAVKRMESGVVSEKGLNEFTSEIAVLTKVRHRHLVALLGYCLDGNERLLVYEYMPQGTLSRFIFNWREEGLKPLEWTKRLTIALDVARGVEYLHSLAHQSFIHRDLKPSNILLGDDIRAKVADFGLVRLAPEGKGSIETRLAGTFGYLAPEYAVTGRVTTKVDVFSFGVILMELITGRKALDDTRPEESMHLVTWFRRMYLDKDTFRKAIDPTIDLDEETLASISTVSELAGHCSAREPSQRPDMSHVVNVLSSLAELWKPADPDSEDIYGIDLDMTLPQALKKWQAFEGNSHMDGSSSSLTSVDNTQTSIPTRPSGFADSFTSADGR